MAAERRRQIDSLTAQLALVEAGYGVAYVPMTFIADAHRAGRVATIEVRGAVVAAAVTLLVRPDRVPHPAVELVDRLLTEHTAPIRAALAGDATSPGSPTATPPRRRR